MRRPPASKLSRGVVCEYLGSLKIRWVDALQMIFRSHAGSPARRESEQTDWGGKVAWTNSWTKHSWCCVENTGKSISHEPHVSWNPSCRSGERTSPRTCVPDKPGLFGWFGGAEGRKQLSVHRVAVVKEKPRDLKEQAKWSGVGGEKKGYLLRSLWDSRNEG